MNIPLNQKVKFLYRKYDWLSIISILLLLHCISAALLLIFDYNAFAQDTVLKTLWKGTWWFFVTATTVGYGDVIPQSIPGQIIAILDMIFGIGLMFTIIGAGADKVIERRRIRMKGLQQLHLHDHIVILGGGAQAKVEKLIQEIRHDTLYEYTDIVICSNSYRENPFPDKVEFIRGKMDASDTLERACVKTANFVIIYGHTDEETILTALAIDEFNRSARTTVYIRNRSNISHIKRLNKVRHGQTDANNRAYPRIRVITRLNDLMLAREISNPGLSEAILILMDSRTGDTFYSLEAWPELDVCIALPEVRKMLRATTAHALIVGVKSYEDGQVRLNPKEDTFVCPKDQIFVIADHRPIMDWSALESKLINANVSVEK